MTKKRTLNPQKYGSSGNCIRLQIISGRYDNPQGDLRIFKEFSTVMRSSKHLLIDMRILEGQGAKIKIAVINNNLNKIGLNKPKSYHRSQTEKMYQRPLCFSKEDQNDESSDLKWSMQSGIQSFLDNNRVDEYLTLCRNPFFCCCRGM